MNGPLDPDPPRSRFVATLRAARLAAYRPGEYVGQENFLSAAGIRALAEAAGVGPGSRVLDLCSGTGGPARYLAEQLACRIVAVDRSLAALRLAQSAARDRGVGPRLACVAADAERLPVSGRFEAVLLIETLLAIRDKAGLLDRIGQLLRPGGRFGCTLEAGRPLTPEEAREMPDSTNIWLVPEAELRTLLAAAGLEIRLVEDQTAAHGDLARRLLASFTAQREAIAAGLGPAICQDIITAHQRWVEWLTAGRVRQLAIVAERPIAGRGNPDNRLSVRSVGTV